MESMETAILEAEEKIAELESLFVDSDFHRKHGQRIDEINQELHEAKERLTVLYQRWEELEQIQAAAEVKK